MLKDMENPSKVSPINSHTRKTRLLIGRYVIRFLVKERSVYHISMTKTNFNFNPTYEWKDTTLSLLKEKNIK